MIIGGNGVEIGTGKGRWELTPNGTSNGLNIEYIPNTENGVQGALYNPDASSGFGNDPFFTQAVLTMEFDGSPVLDESSRNLGSGLEGFSFVRMQNVGAEGEGSLKLPNIPPFDPQGVPEPGTLFLLAGGLLGLRFGGRKA